jgi:hypothetical protein
MIGISRKDFDKIIYFAKASVKEFNGAEIGGMAILEEDKDGDWIIKHPTILKQEVTGGTCTLDKEELANYYTKSAIKYGDNIKFLWWHSHGTGSTFWSPTDETAIKEYSSSNWSVSLVVNAKAEYTLRVDYWKPIPAKLDELELEIVGEVGEKIPISITNQVKKLCSKPATSLATVSQKKHNGQMNYYGYGYGYQGDGWGGGYYGSSWPKEYDILSGKLSYWQRQSIQDTQSELEMFTDGSRSYLDLVGVINDTNNEISHLGKIKIPKEKNLKKMLKNKAKVDILKFWKEA